MNIFKKKSEDNQKLEKEIKAKNKQVKKKNTKEKKVSKLKSDIGVKAVRWFIWTIIILVCIRGVLSIIKPDPVNTVKKNNEEFKVQLSKDNQIESRAFSFAESFTREYFTLYSGEREDYQKRLSKYISRSKIENIDVKGNTSIDSVQAYNIERYSEDQLDVYVHAKTQIRTEKPGQEIITDPNLKQYDVSLKDVYLKVPIYYTSSGEMAVESLPILVGAPKMAMEKVNTENIGLGSASGGVTNEIKDSLNQFFKAYYQADQTQVDYFLQKPGSISAVGMDTSFKGIEKNSVYDLGSNQFKAVVEFKVEMGGKTVNQSSNVNLEYKDNKYLIKTIDSRTVNFK